MLNKKKQRTPAARKSLHKERRFSNVLELNTFLFPSKRKLRNMKHIGREVGAEAAKRRMSELEQQF